MRANNSNSHLCCPYCKGDVIKSGFAVYKDDDKQNYECKRCHKHTVYPDKRKK